MAHAGPGNPGLRTAAALVAGPTGLEIIGRLVRGAPRFLKKRGRLIMEIGCGQAGAVRAFSAADG